MKRYILVPSLLVAMSANVNAMGNACLEVNNRPTHLVLWGTNDLLIYNRGEMTTRFTEPLLQFPFIDVNTNYDISDLDQNNGYAVFVSGPGGSAPTPGPWRVTGRANIFGPSGDHGEEWCNGTASIS